MTTARDLARRGALATLSAASARPVTDAVGGRDRLTALTYHRIDDVARPGFDWDPGVVSATPEMFERQMRYMARNFSVIGLHDLLDHVRGGRPLPDRAALITFDDGYRDNHEHALPVLRALGLPAVVFIVTGAIGTDRVMWWDEVGHLLAHTGRASAELPLVGRRDLAPARRDAVRRELLAALKAVPDEQRDGSMGDLRAALDVPAPRPATPMFMGWDEVAELVAAGIECQPHTVDHPLLVRVPHERARREVRESADETARRTGRPSVAFAYPNGDYDAGTLEALRDGGISLGFTMRLGPCRPAEVRAAPLEIPRIALEARDSWEMFRIKAEGVLSAVVRLRGRLRR